MEHFYSAYGLSIGCDFPLPELMPLEAVPNPDVRVRLADSCGESLEPLESLECARANPVQAFCRLRRNLAEIAWPDVGRFHLEMGRDVRIEPAPEVPETTLRAHFEGPVLSMLLYQRGFLVLHASAAALFDLSDEWGAVGFLGYSGDGKSTMAAALHARGHRMVSDDIVAVPLPGAAAPLDSRFHLYSSAPAQRFPLVFPAYPQLRLWPQSVRALGEDASVLPLLYPHQERRVRRVAQGFETAGVPLRALFVLEESENLTLRRFTPAQAIVQLVQHSYCLNLGDPREAAAQFGKCGALAQTLPVFGLQRPKDLSRLAEVAAFIETNWALQ